MMKSSLHYISLFTKMGNFSSIAGRTTPTINQFVPSLHKLNNCQHIFKNKNASSYKALQYQIVGVDGSHFTKINRGRYRFFKSKVWVSNNIDSLRKIMEKDQVDNIDEKFSDSNVKIVSLGKTKLIHSFRVDKQFFPHIVGSGGNVRRRIETETKTRIEIPARNHDGDIVIIGSDRKDILSARHQIDLIVKSSNKKIRYTHFLSIPLNVDGIIENFNSFKSGVIEKYGGTVTGIEEILFQKPNKLHLTLGMLTLLNEEEIKQAIQTLMDCKQHIIEPFIEKHGLFTIEIKGVEPMNNNPRLMPKRTNDVKLHATFMNISYRRNEHNLTVGKNMYKLFDATKIMKEYKDTSFGKTNLKEIHLSQLKSCTETDYYAAATKITLSEEQQ
ncbi:hypothetical protein M0802_005514 [Mischocyttarus mexicanus]|nr:hypothetical protein M0802_005514 [Mischocyttarus mexicanus]